MQKMANIFMHSGLPTLTVTAIYNSEGY